MNNTEQSEDLTSTDVVIEETGVTTDETIVDDGATSTQQEATDEHEADDKQGEQGNQSKSANRNQRRNRKLRESEAKNAQLAEDNRLLAERLDTLDQKLDGVINPPAPRPSRIDFDTEEEYEDSLFEWRDNTKPVAKTTETVQETAPQQAAPVQNRLTTEQQATIDSFEESFEKAEDKYDDFDEVRHASQSPMTDYMRDAMVESNNGGEVFYYLAKNLAEATRIAGLSITQQINEINGLASKFTQTTTAPAPVDTVEKGHATTGKRVHPSLEGATFT